MTDLQAFNAEDVQNNWCIFNLKPLPKSPEVCVFICNWVCEINNKKNFICEKYSEPKTTKIRLTQ